MPDSRLSGPNPWLRCRDCDASVRADTVCCPLCGAAHPGRTWRALLAVNELFGKVGMYGGGALGLVACAGLVSAWHGGAFAVGAAVAGVAGGFMGASVGALLGGWLDERLQTGTARPGSLATLERTFRKRCAELLVAEHKIEISTKRIAATVAEPRQVDALAALQHAKQASQRQRRRYGVELRRIELARWQNRLEPVADKARDADHDACEALLSELLAANHDGQDLLSRWQETELAQERGMTEVNAALNETLNDCESLRQALLMRQAQTLTESSPGIEEAFSAEAAGLPVVINGAGIAAQVKALADEAPELERERLRLAAELEAIEEVRDEFGVEGD
jgi:hypothetical protein